MFDLSKRVSIIIGAVIIVCGLTAWGTVFVIQKFVLGERDDPLARAGSSSRHLRKSAGISTAIEQLMKKAALIALARDGARPSEPASAQSIP
jgi:hypothetical protein